MPIFTILFLFLLFIVPNSASAQTVLINEFQIESSAQSVELLNVADSTQDISGWYLDDSGGTTFFTIPVDTFILPRSCAVFSGDFNLNKSSPDAIRLFSKDAPPTSQSAVLIDLFSYTRSPGQNLVYLRIPDGEANWSTAEATLGLWNGSKESCVKTITPTPTFIPTAGPVPPVPTATPLVLSPTIFDETYYKVYLSEAMVYPDKENEWVELYNDSSDEVTLQNWYLDDQEEEGSGPKTFSLSLPAKGYAVVELTNPMFNNNKDSVRLLNPEKKLIDSFEYSQTRKDTSFGKNQNSDEFCPQTPSKGYPNNSCLSATTPQPTSQKLQLSNSQTYTPSITKAGRTVSIIRKTNAPLSQKLPQPTPEVLGESQSNKSSFERIRALSFFSTTVSVYSFLSVLFKLWKTTLPTLM